MKIFEFDDDDDFYSEEKINLIIKKIKLMEICNNKNNNYVKFYEYFKSEKGIYFIMELCDCNLKTLLKERKEGFNIEEIYNIMN